MGLEVQDDDHDDQDDAVGHQFKESDALQPVAEPAELGPGIEPPGHTLVTPGQTGGKVDDQGHLAQLRGLPLDGNGEPAGGTAHGLAQAGHVNGQHQGKGHDEDGHSQTLKTPIVELGDKVHNTKAHHRKGGLPLEVVQGVPLGVALQVIDGRGVGGGQEHHQANHHQQDGQQQEGQVYLTLDGLTGLSLLGLYGAFQWFLKSFGHR